MKLSRVILVSSGSRGCNACGKIKEAPCEMYEYIDSLGVKMAVCFECRMTCTPERTVASFTTRYGNS